MACQRVVGEGLVTIMSRTGLLSVAAWIDGSGRRLSKGFCFSFDCDGAAFAKCCWQESVERVTSGQDRMRILGHV